MKALIILPGDRFGVEALSEAAPLANLQLFGTTLAARWLEHAAKMGATHVVLLASDRVDDVRLSVGNGSRWGLEVEVLRESRELTTVEACRKYGVGAQNGWLPAPHDIMVADRLPELPEENLFDSYAQFFAVIKKALALGVGRARVGAREIKPGVWVGLRSRVAADAIIEGPCWLGEGVQVEKGAQIGPNVILEDCTSVGAGAEVNDSYLASETHLGVATSLLHSCALGNLLVDWQANSTARVTDAFLLCAMRGVSLRDRMAQMLARIASVAQPEPRAFPAKSFGWQGPALR